MSLKNDRFADLRREIDRRLQFLSEIVNQPIEVAVKTADKYHFRIVVAYKDHKACLDSLEEGNDVHVYVAVCDGIVRGHTATNYHGEQVWASAACFPHQILKVN